MSAAATSSLAERLRSATREVHRVVERSGLMPALLGGRIERPDYVALLLNLQALYAALEPALQRHAAHAAVGPVVLPRLFRGAALAQDLTSLQAAAGVDLPAIVPATAAYVRRLQQIEGSQPELLVAHAYVRYLGDLAGGQQLRRIVGRSPGLGAAAATRFYDFGDAAEVAALAQRFRAGLERAGALAGDAGIEAIVSEAQSAFERHRLMFEQLAGH